jgi:dienelactone hydrolase
MAKAHERKARAIEITAGRAKLHGDLALPERARGVVLFAHGSGSSRHSARNKAAAAYLNDAGFATLLLDLLTEEEEKVDALTSHIRFDIPLLAIRVEHATHALRERSETASLSIGLFGASTGAAAALIAAAHLPREIAAVVSRGGRGDLAGASLAVVRAPTLFIVGSADGVVLDLNREARAKMTATTELEVIAAASHLFEEPGALERVAELSLAWFERHAARAREKN